MKYIIDEKDLEAILADKYRYDVLVNHIKNWNGYFKVIKDSLRNAKVGSFEEMAHNKALDYVEFYTEEGGLKKNV